MNLRHDINIIKVEDLSVIVSGLVREGVTFEVETNDLVGLISCSEINRAVKYTITLTGGY
jgi:predicted mannosyl-3-phosphoglycerate phosphatase (HAD superfamily)|tara:strand:- start:5 stop:184 length:180 start_codon:yes stop_codon:yes gene_type:complete